MTDSGAGIDRNASRHTGAKSIERLRAQLKRRGILVFARVGFSGDTATVPIVTPTAGSDEPRAAP